MESQVNTIDKSCSCFNQTPKSRLLIQNENVSKNPETWSKGEIMFQNLVHKTKRFVTFMSVNEICNYGGLNE